MHKLFIAASFLLPGNTLLAQTPRAFDSLQQTAALPETNTYRHTHQPNGLSKNPDVSPLSPTNVFRDTAVATANIDLRNPGIVLRIITGGNYRTEWGQYIKVPVFDIKNERPGLAITKPGGGKQTKSLRMIAADSSEWVLRSVDKKLTEAMPVIFRNTPIETFVRDMVSGSHPYGCLPASQLAKALGIIAPDPQLVYLPGDSALGEYRAEFGNALYFFEQRHPLRTNTKPESTENLLVELEKGNSKIVLQKQMLKARLLDMLIGDWDRHQGQWRWGKFDSADRTWYYPVSVDRDQAFFRPKGLLIRMINSTATPFLKGFKRNMNGLYQLNKPARSVDLVFLNEIEQADWIEVINEVRSGLTDSVITNAVDHLPAETREAHKKKLIKTLQQRRDGMAGAAIKYYQRLSRSVYVFSSEKPELFTISEDEDWIRLIVYDSTKENNGIKVYDRTFDKSKTRRIYLVGIGENDDVRSILANRSKIKIIIVKPGSKQDLRNKMLHRIRMLNQG